MKMTDYPPLSLTVTGSLLLVVMVGDAATDLKAAQYCGTQFFWPGKQFAQNKVAWAENLIGLSNYYPKNFDLP